MSATYSERKNEAFSTHQLKNIIQDHTKATTKNLSPISFTDVLKKAKETHQKRPHKTSSIQQSLHFCQPNVKKCNPRPAAIFETPVYPTKVPQIQQPKRLNQEEREINEGQSSVNADVRDVAENIESKNSECDSDLEEREVLGKIVRNTNIQIRAINVKKARRPKRTEKIPIELSPPSIPAEKRTKNMSKHDYNFTQADTVPIGGKQIPGRGYHTSPTDANFGADTAYRQQLQEMAASMGSLCNIGNSCYMNSVIYTLRYTPLFLHNLHHLVSDFAQIFNQKENQQKMKSASLGRNVNGLQSSNARSYSSKDLVSLSSSSSSSVSLPTLDIAKTTQQKASEKLHELFQCLSNNENAETTEPYQSDIFLKAIQDVNPIFEGNQQQDAHEFLMCILDSIRETCQSLRKNVIEHPEIIMQRYNSTVDQVDRQLVKPVPSPPQAIVEKKSGIWFGKKRKDDKTKSTRVDSPSKESRNSSETASASNAASAAATSASAQPMVNGTTDSGASPTSAESVLDKIRELGIDFFSEDFEGETKASTLCLSCETTTEQTETMLDLSVPITENMETHDMDESFIQNLCITKERFQGDNKFRCEKCTGYTEAIRQISYPRLPRVLVIQLKRFSGGMEKINSYIPTPFTLQCFCANCCSKGEGPKDHEYKLYSVITHVGATMCAGHYIAYTCSLNLNSCYQSCPKEAYKNAQAAAAAAAAAATAAALASNTSAANAASSKENKSGNSSSSSSNSVVPGIVKKLIGRAKNADATKNQKNCNGVKGITNGVDGIQLVNNASTSPTANAAATVSGAATNATGIAATPCPSINCCSIKMKTMPKASNSTPINGINNGLSNGDYSSHSRNGSLSSVYSEHDQLVQVNGVNGVATAATNPNSANVQSEPIWFMCDDDKIKAMPQHEFREMLLPNKKNMITPYLLFYARSDVYQPSH